MKAANDPAFGATGARLAEAVDSLERATTWLLGKQKSPQAALAGATPYLRLFGNAAGGCMLADEALAALRARRRRAGSARRAWRGSLRRTSRCRRAGWRRAVTEGADSVNSDATRRLAYSGLSPASISLRRALRGTAAATSFSPSLSERLVDRKARPVRSRSRTGCRSARGNRACGTRSDRPCRCSECASRLQPLPPTRRTPRRACGTRRDARRRRPARAAGRSGCTATCSSAPGRPRPSRRRGRDPFVPDAR